MVRTDPTGPRQSIKDSWLFGHVSWSSFNVSLQVIAILSLEMLQHIAEPLIRLVEGSGERKDGKAERTKVSCIA